MPDNFDWRQAVHDPRFWALRYCCSRYEPFPGVSDEAVDAYISEHDFLHLALLEDDPLAGYVGEGDDPALADVEVGYRRLVLPFPEGSIWQMDFAAEDGEQMTGIYHAISHSALDPTNILGPTSTGISLAEESGHPRLPGLRWAELKQIEVCLTRQGFDLFHVQAIIPLLYRIVNPIAFEELEDVRHTLATAWQELYVLDAVQADQWLDQIITVYHQGQWLKLVAQKEWQPVFPYAHPQPETFWVHTEENGWQTIEGNSERHMWKDTRHFLPFFAMLERYS